ncbi:MAG: hypothetical protein ACYC96_02100 [Fimbriimonadaceae bacterium]
MTPRQLALLERLEVWFDANPRATALDAAHAMRMPPEAATAVIGLGVQCGRIIIIGSEVYTRNGFDALVADLRAKFGDEPFQPRDLRAALREGRGWVDKLAEVLSQKGLLERFPGGWRLQHGE